MSDEYGDHDVVTDHPEDLPVMIGGHMYLKYPSAEFEHGDADLGAVVLEKWYDHCYRMLCEFIEYPLSEAIKCRMRKLALSPLAEDDGFDTNHLLAVKLAALGEYQRAGAVYRGYMATHNARIDLQFRHDGEPSQHKEKRHCTAARIANKAWKEDAAARRKAWIKVGTPLRARHPAMSDLQFSKLLATRCGTPGKAHAIRKALGIMNLKKRQRPGMS